MKNDDHTFRTHLKNFKIASAYTAGAVLGRVVEPGLELDFNRDAPDNDGFRLGFLRALNKRGLWFNFERKVVIVQDKRGGWSPGVAQYGKAGTYDGPRS